MPKSQYAAPDAFLNVNIRILWKEEICKKQFDFIFRIRLYFNPLWTKTITFKTNKTEKQESTTRSYFLSSFKVLIHHKQIPWKCKWTKQHWIILKKRRLTTIIIAEMKLALIKKIFAMKKNYFQSIISWIRACKRLTMNKVSTNCGLTIVDYWKFLTLLTTVVYILTAGKP